MNTLTAVRLGKVNAGEEKTKEEGMEKKNIAAPIVLWSKDTAAGVLYSNKEYRGMTGAFTQKIDYLVPPGKGVKGRLKALTDAYPITYSAHGIFKKEDEKTLNSIAEIYTKDVNGDGIDELILTRSQGAMEVYNREKQILKYKPGSNPKLYKYKMKDVNSTTLGDHDEIFFTAEQDPYDSVNATTRDSWIVRVSPKGITEIHPVFPDHSEPTSIETAIGMNRPGSRIVDELIVISTIKGRKGYYLSRHNLDGKAIEMPREIYTDYGIYCGAFGFSQSNQFIINNGQQKMLYFVTPGKQVNWIKTINLVKLFGKDADVNIIGETVINNLALLVLEDHGKLYALDALGKFHTSMKPESQTSIKPVAFMTLKPDSKLHKIIKITPTDKTMESFLVIQSREPGKRELTIQELEKAGKKFLTDNDWNSCKEELRLKYNEIIHEETDNYCRKHKIPMPEIHSWEDIKKKLPGYYKEELEYAQRKYRRALETSLFHSIETEGYILEAADYKNMEEYKIWLNSVFVSPELVFSIQHISKGTIGHQRQTNYYFKELEAQSGFSQPSINVRASGEHGQAFIVLFQKVVDKKDLKPAYYSLAW